jgi:hypothetical protein
MTDASAEARDVIEMAVQSCATRRAMPEAILAALERAGFVIRRAPSRDETT